MNRLPLAIALAGLLLRLIVAWQPVPTLVQKNLPDDAYYYFVIAHNLIDSGSVSLDGVNPTNGFHPLWLGVMAMVFGGRLFGGSLGIHVALTLGATLDALSIWVIGRIAFRLTQKPVSASLACTLYAANPSAILQSTNGLETSLGVLLVVAFLLAFLSWLQAPGLRWTTPVVGVLGGLMLLARSDSAFYLVLAMLAAVIYWRPSKGIARILPACVLSFLVVLPWLAWSRASTGTWIQESGVAVPYAIYARLLAGRAPTPIGLATEAVKQLTYPPMWMRGDPTGLPMALGGVLWLLALAGVALRWMRLRPWPEVATLGSAILAGGAMIILHAGIRWYARPWYFIPSAAVFAIASSVVAVEFQWLRTRLSLVVPAFLAYFALAGYVFWVVGFYPWQSQMLSAASQLGEMTPEGSTLGSFNAGIYAYYSGRRVVNLDGVVNHEAFEAVKSASILLYLVQSKVDFVIDYDSAVTREYGRFMGTPGDGHLEEVAVLGGNEAGPLGLLRLYRIHQ